MNLYFLEWTLKGSFVLITTLSSKILDPPLPVDPKRVLRQSSIVIYNASMTIMIDSTKASLSFHHLYWKKFAIKENLIEFYYYFR
jgi:hypothetical protein